MSKLFVVSLALALSAGAHAAPITFTSTPYDVSPGPGQVVVLNFESTTPPPGFSITGTNFGYHTGSLINQYAAPANDTTQYLAVMAGGSATISFPAFLQSWSFYLGSLDTYNTLTFSGAGFSQSFTGTQLTPAANGDQGSGATNRRYFFTIPLLDQVNKVTFTSSVNSFEFDNIATGFASSGAPEPASWAMIVVGVGMIGHALRARRTALRRA